MVIGETHCCMHNNQRYFHLLIQFHLKKVIITQPILLEKVFRGVFETFAENVLGKLKQISFLPTHKNYFYSI